MIEISQQAGKFVTRVSEGSDEPTQVYVGNDFSVYYFGIIENLPPIGLEAYPLESDAAVARLDGHFSIVIVNHLEENVEILASRAGGGRVFWREQDGDILISDRLAEVCGSSSDLSLDPLGAYEMLNYRWTSGSSTPVANISTVPRGHRCSISFRSPESPSLKMYHSFYDHLANQETLITTIEEHAYAVSGLLTSAIQTGTKGADRVAVLLSGGVDSSVLSALGNDVLPNLVAVSHCDTVHHNPELDTARQFARELGIEHRVVSVSDDLIADAFEQVVEIIEQPPRYPSSVLLYLMFKDIAEDFDSVLYGEPADCLFGGKVAMRYFIRSQKAQKLHAITDTLPVLKSVLNLLPDQNKLRLLQASSLRGFCYDATHLSLSKRARQAVAQLHPNIGDEDLDVDGLFRLPLNPHEGTDAERINLYKAFRYHTDATNHFYETGRLASHFGLRLVSPYANSQVIDYAGQLSFSAYFGDDFVKPILRKIGEKYFTKSLMYLPKRGFPAPYEAWLAGDLCAQWHLCCDRLEIDRDCFATDPEMQWTLAGLQILSTRLGIALPKIG